MDEESPSLDEEFGERDLPHYAVSPPSQSQLWLAGFNICFPPVFLLWAHANTYSIFFEWQTLGGLVLLLLLGVDTFYQRWQAASYEGLR